jgi:glutaminase
MNEMLNDILNNVRPHIDKGKVADYIPELKKADPKHLGVYITTATGECFHAGDWEQTFTIQSIAKTITLILALKTAGKDKVFSRVGMESSGDAFNSIMKLEYAVLKNEKPIPFNPMINAGAIATASCCVYSKEEPYSEFLDLTQKLCGCEKIHMNQDVYLSEKKTGLRNLAMAYLMKNEGILKCDPLKAVDFYFKTCSTAANSKNLAHYAMILANNGKNPSTGETLIDEWIVPIIKTIMFTCGMYDASGEFAVNVGLPAKSGVGGGIIACAENNMGIAVFGPALDKKGYSLGGYLILKQLSEKLNLHMFSGNVSYLKNNNITSP